MKKFELEQKVCAFYQSDKNGNQRKVVGQIIDISLLKAGNVMARVYAVKSDDGTIDTFSEGYIFPLEENP